MPKVETLHEWGKQDINKNIYVSNKIGHELRYKRDSIDEIPKFKRVIKKLIRKVPLHSTTETNDITTRRHRRRIVIKKKKKKRKLISSTISGSKEVTGRRKVVVTRKRLLPKSTINNIVTPTSISSKSEELVNTSSHEIELIGSIPIEEKDDSTESYEEELTKPNEVETTESYEDEYGTTETEAKDSGEQSIEEENIESPPQHVPDYEPFFPELSDTLDAPVLLLKTTVLSSIELVTKTVVQSRLRTYTFLITRVNGDEHIMTSTTEIRPQTKTTILTESMTKYTTLTLLDIDASSTHNPIPMTPFPASSQLNNEQEGRAYDEARYNLATRVMSNGVEVIVAGDKSTLPGEPDIKRVLPSTIYKAVTLKPSTLSDHMMMLIPQDASNLNSLTLSNQFVTKTCLTTFTYLTTYLESGTTTVSSHEQVVSNVATEERNTGKILPTPAVGVTLTQYPTLSVGVFHTTYTYLNTVLDGEQPLVVTSKHTVTNTVTAPDDYLSLLQPSINLSAIKDTNTYYSTLSLQKTLYDSDSTKVISTNEIVTQVVITESVPPKATSVMTSYIALDFDQNPTSVNYTTTDVVKTYYVTYTYYNTLLENNSTVVKQNVSTSSDIVTEKLYLYLKKTEGVNSSKKDEKKKQKVDLSPENFLILATKTYHTTFTYFTTLLQDNAATPTVISSHSKIIENAVTETIDHSLLDKKFLKRIKSDLKDGTDMMITTATLNDGQKLEIKIVANNINPTKVLPIVKTKMPSIIENSSSIELESSAPSVIIGSTIIFLDEEPAIETPSLASTTQIIKNSKVFKNTKIVTSTSKLRRATKSKNKSQTGSLVSSTKSSTFEKKPATKKPASTQVPDLLGLGSLNIKALTPVLNAMAGLIQTNLKSNRRNDSTTSGTINSPVTGRPSSKEDVDISNRSPIYIPVGGLGDELEIAESQNIATFHLQETVDNWDKSNKQNKPKHEALILNGGIPISPGDVITANSDVIVGKPGRILPRIPSIPLNQVQIEDYELQPPPIASKLWPKRNLHPTNGNKIIRPPSNDDYIGPPPPLLPPTNKHIPLSHYSDQTYAQSHKNYLYDIKDINIRNTSFDSQFSNPITNFNIQPSIVLPEIIERSTGQPLLVNIQPSQVAFVNIPHNRTTALIYGGSTEPHRNGQYFDDPSPYPEPEFSAIESFNNGIPKFASIYQDNSNQKQVGGVIKVAPQPIDLHSNHDQQIQFSIKPSKPTNNEIIINNNHPSHEININVPPISFGMIHKDNDFNAHIIKHDDTEFSLPPVSLNVIQNFGNRYADNLQYNYGAVPVFNKNQQQTSQNQQVPNLSGEILDLKPPNDFINKPNDIIMDLKPPILEKPSTYKQQDHRRRRPTLKPTQQISEFMTPPPFTSNRVNIKSKTRPSLQTPLPIPINSEPNNNIPVLNHNIYMNTEDEDDDDDLTNEDGEVIQESNSRPLVPGQLPLEILRIKPTEKNTQNSTIFQNINSYNGHIDYHPRPIVSNPRPFRNDLVIKPENQQTNQINNFDYEQLFEATSKPEQSFITFIGTSVTSPPVQNNAAPTTLKSKYFNSSTTFSNQGFITFIGTTTRRPVTTTFNPTIEHKRRPTRPRFDKASTTISAPFGIKTKRPIPTYISTTQRPQIISSRPKVNHNKYINERPKVTSLPVDTYTSNSKIPNFSQTEKPFKPYLTLTEFLNREKVTTTVTSLPELNLGEISTPFSNVTEQSLEIMKPPPPSPEITMQPPKFEINHINKVAPVVIESDLEAHASTTRPYIKKPSESIIPPPLEEVIGLSPPSPGTHKPILEPVTTSKPFVANITKISRRPFTRRPSSRRPVRPNYEIYSQNLTTIQKETSTTEKVPLMEVIIGNPNIKPSTYEVINSDVESTVTPQLSTTTFESNNKTNYSESTPKTDILTTAVHHAGNEIKIIDDISANSSTSSKTSTTTKSKIVIPTRYITHTKTSTVTITKTTVVKTLGGPPSTLTLLVTKTEKATIIDTVTQVHTLVKPTSIVETITTTINSGSSLYPPEVYGSTYPAINLKPTSTLQYPVIPTISAEVEDDDLEDFIIKDSDTTSESNEDLSAENDSIFVVMTDKNKGSVIRVPNSSSETQERDEVLNSNEVNNILLGGVFVSSSPSLEVPRPKTNKCEPECKAARNELCQKVEGIMRCVCRPGFARMFPDRPCLPTYTYTLQVNLDRIGREPLQFTKDLTVHNSTQFKKLTRSVHDALDRMVMQSDLRDIYHGVHVHSYAPDTHSDVIAKFYLQLSDNVDENRLEDVFKKYLRNNNYSLGGTEIYAVRDNLNLEAHDFDECTNTKYHDCSENAQCFNLKGTYTCSCKEGFADISENIVYPGRICSAEMIGCERCNYHGTCYSRGDDQVFCECFHWYIGKSCHINLKVLLIALVTLGVILFILLLLCVIFTCCRRKPETRKTTGMSFLPQRIQSNRVTMDRRAMIQDTSSEDSRSESNNIPPYPKKKLKGALKKSSSPSDVEIGVNDQKDRSLTVMIPRAKYHPAPPTSPLINYTTFDAKKPSVPSTSNEAKLLSYLDAGPSPNKPDSKRKYSNAQSDSYTDNQNMSRKTSGALVSAGFEVSATVMVNNMGTLGTTCGTEADRSENATLIQKISADLLSSTGTRSNFNTIRKSLVDNDLDPMEDWLDIRPCINTVSEARSYEETTVPLPMKSFRTDYDSKPSSQHQNDEANTMAERDLGSTFLLPHTHLYKPDRGSDISGFESL